jgi:heat shock protein HslJ
MTIPPIEWHLVEFIDSMAGSTAVDDPTRYTVQFRPDGSVGIRADCNRGVGEYTVEGSGITFGPIATTLVLCPPDSLSDRFLKELNEVRSFVIDDSGASDALVMSFMADGGMLRFEPALTGVVWEWQRFEGGDGAIVAPDDPSQYTLAFAGDGTVTGQVDCNRGIGTANVDAPAIEIVLATTRMMCSEESLDAEFLRYVTESNSFVIRDGQFSLALPMDSGIATFSPVIEE